MDYQIRTQPEEWACTKFCRIGLDDKSSWEFILWLCNRTDEQIAAEQAVTDKGGPAFYDLVEETWGFDAPRQRMAKLLWQFLHQASDEQFHHNFSFASPIECGNSSELLGPIQQRMRWVLDGLVSRREQDDRLGQGEWGEQWWLPPKQSRLVREQLKDTHPALIEHGSEYEEVVRHGLSYYIRHKVEAIAIPCTDPARVYVGQRLRRSVRAWIKDANGKRYPLKHGDRPYQETDGSGFEWGYGGHGPGSFTRCILIDALDGDLPLANEIDRLTPGFFEKFVLHHPRDKNFRMSRAAVHRWLKEIDKLAMYEARRELVASRIATHAVVIAEREALLTRIDETGGLHSQRFDIVPESFESALYLDLMRMLELGGAALRCSRCKLPIPDDHSGKANKQRARSRSGQPIYHPECLSAQSRDRKKSYWRQRAKSPAFQEKERARARAYRKQ
jgi:hypothetical protein